MDQRPDPGPTQRDDADHPDPVPAGVPARDWDDGWDGLPKCPPEDDFDADAEMARWVADTEAGRERIPEPWELEGPAVTISLGDAADVDPAVLAAMLGPDGLAGESFGADRAGDALPPGPVLAALAEQAAGDLGTLADDAVLGLISGARRLRNRAEYLELRAVAEFARRRAAQAEAATAGKVRPGRRDGEFADSELAMELLVTQNAAGERMDMAADLDARLPHTLAGVAAGVIDGGRAHAVWLYTRWLSDTDAAVADKVLAEAAPGLRYDQLARKAAALETKLDPEAARTRREKARRDDGRVEVRREASGNASLSGRELGLGDVLAAKANLDALAVVLRRSGAAGTLRELRVRVYMDLLQGRDPLTQPAISPATSTADDGSPSASASASTGYDGKRSRGEAHGHEHPHDPGHHGDPDAGDPDAGDGGYAYRGSPGGGRSSFGGSAGDGADGEGPQYAYLGADDDEDEDESADEADAGVADGKAEGKKGSGGGSAGPAAPLPALINLIVPIGTALGWSSAPGSAGSWGLTDPADTRALLRSASRHSRTRTCVTIIGPDGTAIAHGCARGQHPWDPPPPPDTAPPDTACPCAGPPCAGPGRADQASSGRAEQIAQWLRRLNLVLEPVARGTCDHRHAEDRYRPSRTLQHLIRARTATCSAPGCNAQAVHCDIDHVIPYPDGPTDECNTHPGCRRHHRCKQAPGWQVDQPEPGVMRWTTPAGRTYTTTPTVYDAE